MAYATLADIEKWIDADTLVRLTDDGGLGIVDTAVVDAVLDAASLEIDGYLGGRYTLPLAQPPAILAKLCVDIAGYLLHIRRDEVPADYWTRQYDNAVAFLRRVADGRISLGAGDPEGTGAGGRPQFSGPDRQMSRDALKGW